MKAFLLDRYAKHASLRLGDLPVPVPGDDEVLVQIHAAGLNLLDSKIKSGAIRPVMDKVFPFESTNEAIAYIEKGRAKGKVVIKIK